MTGKAHSISCMMRTFGMRDDRKPVSRIKIRTMPPRGNWKRIESSVLHPNAGGTVSGLIVSPAIG